MHPESEIMYRPENWKHCEDLMWCKEYFTAKGITSIHLKSVHIWDLHSDISLEKIKRLFTKTFETFLGLMIIRVSVSSFLNFLTDHA